MSICPKETYRARFGDTDWEQHFEIWSVNPEQDSIECWRNGEFGDGSIVSKENTEIRETFWVREQVRDEDVSTIKEKKRANVATKRTTKPNQSLLMYYDIVQIARLVPLQDDGDKPMMDLV